MGYIYIYIYICIYIYNVYVYIYIYTYGSWDRGTIWKSMAAAAGRPRRSRTAPAPTPPRPGAPAAAARVQKPLSNSMLAYYYLQIAPLSRDPCVSWEAQAHQISTANLRTKIPGGVLMSRGKSLSQRILAGIILVGILTIVYLRNGRTP